MGLIVIESNTKYMIMTRNIVTKIVLNVESLTFEHVED